MKYQIGLALAFVGMAFVACSRNNGNQPHQQQQVVPPVTNQFPQGYPPSYPNSPNNQPGMADNSESALALVMGVPVTNVSFLVTNHSPRICRNEAMGSNANALTPVNPYAMLYFTHSFPTYRSNGYYIVRGCPVHEAASLQLDFGPDAVLSATLQAGGEIFRGTRIPYNWDPGTRSLVISNFEVRSATANALTDIVQVSSSSKRRFFLDQERKKFPGFLAEWQPEVDGRGYADRQQALSAWQMRVSGSLDFQFEKQTPSQTVQMNGTHAKVNIGAVPVFPRRTMGISYLKPIAGSIMTSGPGTGPVPPSGR